MILHRNQIFRTTDALMLVVLIGLVTIISSAIVLDAFTDRNEERALITAEVLAFQLANGGFTGIRGAGVNRAPASISEVDWTSSSIASEGQIGKDPWGRPYHYRIQRHSDGSIARVDILSRGEDGELSVSFADLETTVRRPGRVGGGDDLGYAYLAQKN